MIISFSEKHIRERLRRIRTRIYVAAAIPLILLFTSYSVLYVGIGDDSGDRSVLTFHMFWVALFLIPSVLLIAYVVPTHYRRYFNGFAVYERGISPPFRNLSSIPNPPLVTGWSISRFVKALVARIRRDGLFVPLSRIKGFTKVRAWEDSFVFDVVTIDDVRIRIMAPELETFYFPGDRGMLLAAYEMLEQVREQFQAGAAFFSIGEELTGQLRST